MRTLATLLAILALTLSSTFAYDGHDGDFVISSQRCDGGDWFFDDWASFDIDDGDIILKYDDPDNTVVRITEDYELYVDGEKVDLDDDQQELVKEFHVGAMEIVDRALEVGWEGAKIGAEGAKIGVAAMTGLLKALLTNYTMEDLEDDLEYEADRLEEKAEVLGEEAEIIEDMAEDLEDVYWDMVEQIDEFPKIENRRRHWSDEDEI
jgi:hypothetical protein